MRQPVPILMYHRLGAMRKASVAPAHYVKRRQFENHLKLLRALRKTPISLAQLKSAFEGDEVLPSKAVVVTFDDGYRSFYEIGLPILQAHAVPATVFLVSACVGKNNEWDLQIGDVEEPLMSRKEVLDASRKGIEFGSHTVNHARLTDLSEPHAREEIERSKADLEEWMDQPANFFCYPYGKESASIRALVQQAGYKGATTVQKGLNTAATDPFGWGRINVRSTTSNFQMAYKLWRAKPLT